MSGLDREKKHLFSTAVRRTNEWIYSQEIPSDITVQVGSATFSLHKFPLLSKCGYIRKLLSKASDSSAAFIEIPNIPGGIEAFELAVKFCYGINFEISTNNIAMLRCASEYLEMTEEYSVGNLVVRAEAYLEEVVLLSLSGAISVLHKSEELLPIAEEVKLVNRCINAITYIACNDSQLSLSLKTDNSQESLSSSSSQPKFIVDWWAEELTVLTISTFRRVFMAMKARGFKEHGLGPLLMLYVQKSLRGLDMFGRGKQKIELKQEHEKRVVLETIVSLLPSERNSMSVSFLSTLLRSAIYLDTTVACRLALEKRIGMQLGQAVLDDLLVPSFSFNGDAMFDVDTVQRILVNYIDQDLDDSRLRYNFNDDYASPPPPPGDIERVGRLMESYLAEVASDPNLTISRFMNLAETIPEQARVNEDGIYRAIDIYLKAHPSLSDIERKNVCGLMNCSKLSREACAHAAKNDRLPVHTVVHVLYCEQRRLQDTMSRSLSRAESPSPSSFGSTCHDASGELSRLHRENEDLKLELVRMQMQLKETGKPSGVVASVDKPQFPKKSFISSVSKKFSRLYPFLRSDYVNPPSSKGRTKPPKDRRHSVA